MKSTLLTYRLLLKNPIIFISKILNFIVVILSIFLVLNHYVDSIDFLPLFYVLLLYTSKSLARDHYYFLTNTLRVIFKDILMTEIVFLIEFLSIVTIASLFNEYKLDLSFYIISCTLILLILRETTPMCYIDVKKEKKFKKLRMKYFNPVEDISMMILFSLIVIAITLIGEHFFLLQLLVYLFFYGAFFSDVSKREKSTVREHD